LCLLSNCRETSAPPAPHINTPPPDIFETSQSMEMDLRSAADLFRNLMEVHDELFQAMNRQDFGQGYLTNAHIVIFIFANVYLSYDIIILKTY